MIDPALAEDQCGCAAGPTPRCGTRSDRYGPSTTCYNRFVRWRKAGVWDRLLATVSAAFDGEIVMIDFTCARVHQHGATGKKGEPVIAAWDVPEAASRARSMPSLTLTVIPLLCD
jgi:hypothetical protein